MIDWSIARNTVATTFFDDKVVLYQLHQQEDDIGEVFEVPDEEGEEISCNIQYQPISEEDNVQGINTPQTARVSMPKDAPLVRGSRYQLKILQARVQFDPDEYWDVVDWVEGQISTVATIQRRLEV